MTTTWCRTGPLGLATALLLFCTAQPSHAQAPSSAAVRGVVVDAAGEPLSQVLVTLTAASTGLARQAPTDRTGAWSFAFVAPGDYEIFIERIGFVPMRVVELAVSPGGTTHLRTVVRSTAGPAMQIDTVMFAAADVARFGARERVSTALLQALPSPRQSLYDLARASARVSTDGVAEGLPATFNGVLLDGVLFRPVAHRLTPEGGVGTMPLSLFALQAGELLSNPVDVEWGRVAGTTVHGWSGPRSAGAGLELSARAATGALSPGNAGATPGISALASGVWNSLLEEGRAHVRLGVTARRLSVPAATAWPTTPGAASLAELGTTRGLNLTRYQTGAASTEQSISGFGSLDWLVSDAHRLLVSVHAGGIGSAPATRTTPFGEVSGLDVAVGASVYSILSPRVGNEVRVAFTRSERQGAGSFSSPPTFIAGDALAFGGPTETALNRETRVSVTEALHLHVGRAALKGGLELSGTAHVVEGRRNQSGQYWYGSVSRLVRGEGVFTRTEGPGAVATWTTPRPAFFGQVLFGATSDLEVLVGLRAERENVPGDGVRADTTWLRLTGVSNLEAPDAGWRMSPRLGITWDLERQRRWVFSAGAGLYHDRIDPLLLAEWRTDDGTASVRRAVGNVAWPQPGASPGTARPRLTVLAPGLQAPRTGRASAALSHAPSPGTIITVGGSIRRTENLPRRSDLNLLPLPTARDQYGRGLHGTLLQHGGVLAAEPGTGRRFATYDEVAGITDNGWSEHWGIDVSLEHGADAGFGLLARYSFGQARDNWVGAASGGWTVPAPTGFDAAADWADGPSDFDVPHRLVAGGTFRGPMGLRASALYRGESGRPFTPGFRAGVDADADGHAGNEVAFIDASLPGVAEVMAAHPCLQSSTGRFAARNSCRAAAVHTIDLSVGADLVRRGGTSIGLVAELVDMLGAHRRMPDSALYLIDESRQLTRDAAARTVNVPLIANPDFGAALPQRYPGRMLRLGVEVNW